MAITLSFLRIIKILSQLDYISFVGNLVLFQAVKNFANPLRIDKVIAMSLLYYFLGRSVCSVLLTEKYGSLTTLQSFGCKC